MTILPQDLANDWELEDDWDLQDEQLELDILAELSELPKDTCSNGDSPLEAIISRCGLDFQVTQESRYTDGAWNFGYSKSGKLKVCYFKSLTPGFTSLHKAMTFYYTAPSAVFPSIRKNSTTYKRHFSFTYIDEYVFTANHLRATPEHIALIDRTLLERALASARDSGTPSHYPSLYHSLCDWLALSNQNYLPEELRLTVTLGDIASKERSREISNIWLGSLQPWVAYSEKDLESLCNYAFYWLEKVSPEMLKIRDSIKELYPNDIRKKITTKELLPDLEQKFLVEIDDQVVMSLQHSKSGYTYTYSWLSKYAEILDNIRCALYIVIALVTGGRASELCGLKASDIIKRADGDYDIRMTVYKTSGDKLQGTLVILPFPRFAAESVLIYHELRQVVKFKKNIYLFQSNQAKKVSSRPNTSYIDVILKYLYQETGVLRLHNHRFRKTIAEMIIKHDERDVDLIRMLFDHKSYEMTLKYIARNPLMVHAVALSLETSYTKDLREIIDGIQTGEFSGEAAAEIKTIVDQNPSSFSGKRLKVTLIQYVSNLLERGESIYLSRTALGTFCLSTKTIVADNLPPCIQDLPGFNNYRPYPTRCHYECKQAIVLSNARQSLEDNIAFFRRILDYRSDSIHPAQVLRILKTIRTCEEHLKRLNQGVSSSLIKSISV